MSHIVVHMSLRFAYAEIGSLGSVAKFVIYYGGFDMPTVAPLNKEILQKVTSEGWLSVVQMEARQPVENTEISIWCADPGGLRKSAILYGMVVVCSFVT